MTCRYVLEHDKYICTQFLHFSPGFNSCILLFVILGGEARPLITADRAAIKLR